GFSERGKFRQDPALSIPPIPAVAPAETLASLPAGSHLERVTRVHVIRGLNQVTWAFRQARREAELALQAAG
ncbi:MAG TPA: peptidase M28, partial [Bacillota bacterium]